MEPNWNPLEKILGRKRCAGFMYMGRVNGINLYKHGISRTYLNLDDEGNCYAPAERGCYVPVSFQSELAKLQECLKASQATLETVYNEEFIARKRRLLYQHGISLVTIRVEAEDVLIH